MTAREKRPFLNGDLTVEEQAPEFDPARTDRIEKPDFVSTRHDVTGVVEHDERGQARWVWIPETSPSSDADATFDELRALTNDQLALTDAPAYEPTPSPGSGYNPYDTNIMPQLPRKRR